MEIAKSLFGDRLHEGYAGRDDYNQRVETAASEDEGNPDYVDDGTLNSLSSIKYGKLPLKEGPFSALTFSMVPQKDLLKGKPNEESSPEPDLRFDEFGFRIEEGLDEKLNKPFIEDPQLRLQWIAHLEFSHNKEVAEFAWDNVDTKLPRTEKLRSMVAEGIPHSLRHHMWMRMSGALEKKTLSEINYKEIIKMSSNDSLMTSKQIEKDLLRIMPSNVCFSNSDSIGIPRLRRVLRALAWLYPDIGYCQGTGIIAASVLLFLEEEDAFWLLATMVEDLLPASYYSSTLVGVRADQRVMISLITTFLPSIDALLKEHDIELSLITLNWFLTLFASVVHMKLLLRIWDLFFFDGSIVIFKITLGMLKLKEPELLQSENSAQIFNLLSDIPGELDDVELLINTALEVSASLTEMLVETHRRRHLAYLMADQGALVGNPEVVSNLPKQHLSRRQLRKSKSMIQLLLFGEEVDEEDIKFKNIKHTEILVDLREAVLQVARHFMSLDPKLNKVVLVPDYSMESHALDHENYVNVSRTKKRRAKALLDFERHDDDELGFRKNDIITVINQKDEHCWIGELNGLRGWFPAKFVELLDERSKQYSCAGDDSVSEAVTDLVRGTLCPVIKQVLEHGMKKPSFLGGPCHPWLFIEEAATKEVERDFNSVYSRLVLCKTYRLDEDGKVLTPEEVAPDSNLLLLSILPALSLAVTPDVSPTSRLLPSSMGIFYDLLFTLTLFCEWTFTTKRQYKCYSLVWSQSQTQRGIIPKELLYRCVQSINLSHDNAHAQMDVKLRSLICLGLNEQVLHLWLEILCSCFEVVQKWYQPWSFINSPGWVQIKCELRVLSQFAFNLNPDWELPPKKEQSQPLKDGVRDMLVKHHLFSWDL